LKQGLEQQVLQQKLSADHAAALLLIGDMQAHLAFALETAPFLRAGHRQQGAALEAALIEGVLSYLDPAVLRLYKKFCDHYLQLKADMSPAGLEAWSKAALGFLADALWERKLPVRFAVVRARSGGKPRPLSRRGRPLGVRNSLEHEGGSP
jgi:hypothetical protein